MTFDLDLIGDANPFGGGFEYGASDVFDIDLMLAASRFQEKMKVKKIPESIDVDWDFLDLDFTIVQDELVSVDIDGYINVDMSSSIEEFAIYYPSVNPDAPDAPLLTVDDIPSSRRMEVGVSLDIVNDSMVTIDAGAYFEHTKSSSLGDVRIYWPKADPYDLDVVLAEIPADSISSSGRTEAALTIEWEPGNFLGNLDNYFYCNIERHSNSNFGEISIYLPNMELPIFQVTDIPANSYARGEVYWNKLQGWARAQRTSAGGAIDPVHINFELGPLIFGFMLELGDGHMFVDTKLNTDGYFIYDSEFDVNNKVFSFSNTDTQDSLLLQAGNIIADNFEVYWVLDDSGQQLKVDSLALNGKLKSLGPFSVDINLGGKNGNFDGHWLAGEEGGFNIDFYQAEPTRIDFNLDEFDKLDLYGHVTISDHIHFDTSWKWKQGNSPTDPGFIAINDNTNQANILEIELVVTYNDQYGIDIKILDATLYFKLRWYKIQGQTLPELWPEYYIGGTIDHIHLLWDTDGNGPTPPVWYYNVHTWW